MPFSSLVCTCTVGHLAKQPSIIITRRMQSICGASATSKHKYNKEISICVGHAGFRIQNDASIYEGTSGYTMMRVWRNKWIHNDESMILPADKGNATVILDKEEYSKKMKSLFDNKTTYRPVSRDPTTRIKKKIAESVRNLHGVSLLLLYKMY